MLPQNTSVCLQLIGLILDLLAFLILTGAALEARELEDAATAKSEASKVFMILAVRAQGTGQGNFDLERSVERNSEADQTILGIMKKSEARSG
jgi:hypothetical protein